MSNTMSTIMKRRVVVTGLGPVTPIGIGAKDFAAAQFAGKSGVRKISRFDVSDYPVQIAGEVDIDLDSYIDKKQRRRMDRFAQLGLAAAMLAVEDAALDIGNIDRSRAGALVGTGIGGMESFEKQAHTAHSKHPLRISPFFIPMLSANMAASHIAMHYHLMGPSSCVVTACSTGTDAIGNAFRSIQYGEADVMLTGGAEAVITPMTLSGFAVMKALSTRNDSPEQASRPFSASRDGFVMGEGAAVLVLESLEHAEARGAHIYAELTGFGRSADAHHMTEPHPEGAGAALAMQAAIRDSDIPPNSIGYVNAHATSTPVGDSAEVQAIKTVFGGHAYHLAVSSTKSMTGHLLGATGAMEAIASIQALANNTLPPTINLDDPEKGLDLDFVPNKARPAQLNAVLSNSFAFGGMNASLVFKECL